MVLPSSVKGKSKKYPGEYDGDFSEKFTMKERKEVQQRVLLCGSNLEFLRLESLAGFEITINHQIDKVCLF